MKTTELQETVTKVGNLFRKAGDDAASDAEAHGAAKAALALITEHDLVLVPRSEMQRAQAAVEGNRSLAKQVQEQKNKGMLIGGILGFMAGGGKLGRFGR